MIYYSLYTRSDFMNLYYQFNTSMKKPFGFITENGLKQLNKYQYKSGGVTSLDVTMNPFWQWCVKQVPLWVAPNVLTLLGWLFVVLSFSIILIYDQTLQKNIPSWCFFFIAVCIFTYSTLDAIDGKQARRTKSSSPLGQLFDHGCDSFSVAFFVLGLCQAGKLNDSEVIALMISTQYTFWISNWIQYHTGILMTKVGEFGVTQGEYLCAIFHLITGFKGQDIWQIKFQDIAYFMPEDIASIKIGTFIAYFFSALLILLSTITFLKTVYQLKNRNQLIMQQLTLVFIFAMEIIWVNLKIYQKFQGFILVNFGLLVSMLVCKIIISTVTKMELTYFHNQLIIFLIATILMMGFELQQDFKKAQVVFWGCFFMNIVLIGWFLMTTIRQITQHLKIYCFSLVKKEDSNKKKQI